MRYVLINHVPFGKGSSADTFRVGDMWLEDLRAQAKAIRDAGMELVVATPLMEKLEHSGSFNSVEIRPQDHVFSYEPLPVYISFKQFMQVKRALIERLFAIIRAGDLVQCGYGGHPVALGEIAWPVAAKRGAKRIWVFDGADPFPRLELHAAQEKNFVKRFAKRFAVKKFAMFCERAVREADLVFAHNAAVAERFKSAWNGRCHQFDRSFVTDAILIDDAELKRRQDRLLDVAAPLRLVVAGRQIAIKATDHVLRAMKQSRDRGANIELAVMGDGEDLGKFKSLSTELGLDQVVRFAGTVPYGQPLFDAWSDAHVMVITNLTAEISRNVLLAMARGLPLVMYANPGTDELVRSNDAGVLVPTGDIDALAQTLDRLAADRLLLAHLCENGLKIARRNTLDSTHRRRAELARSLHART